MWIFQGSPFYLDKQAKRLRIAQRLAHASRSNPEIYKLALAIGQLCGHLAAAEKVRRFGGSENPVAELPLPHQFRASLERCGEEAAKLHLLAAAAEQMLNEAYDACGIERPPTTYEIMSEFDEPPPKAAVDPIAAPEFEDVITPDDGVGDGVYFGAPDDIDATGDVESREVFTSGN